MVIVDTSAWIQFFNRPESAERHAIDVLIDADRAVMVGVVLAELLQGCRTSQESSAILSEVRGLRFLDTDFATWRRTGELSRALRSRGVTLPLPDILIAALATEHNCPVYTLDPHFEQIPGLSLYRPSRQRFIAR